MNRLNEVSGLLELTFAHLTQNPNDDGTCTEAGGTKEYVNCEVSAAPVWAAESTYLTAIAVAE
jgi:hypothetical protein